MKGYCFDRKTAVNAERVLRQWYTVQLTKGSGVDPTRGHVDEVRSKFVVETKTSLHPQHEHLFRELGLNPNPPMDPDGGREDSGRGGRELQAR